MAGGSDGVGCRMRFGGRVGSGNEAVAVKILDRDHAPFAVWGVADANFTQGLGGSQRCVFRWPLVGVDVDAMAEDFGPSVGGLEEEGEHGGW